MAWGSNRYGGGSNSLTNAPVLLDQPGATVSPSIGKGSQRTRFSHPTGPVAVARYRPLRSNLPVRPNAVQR